MRALITGARGSAAHYLGLHLAERGDYVLGIGRPDCDLTDLEHLVPRLAVARPDVIYHLAANAHVRQSYEEPQAIITNNEIGTVNLFEALRRLNLRPLVEICSTSEVYGEPDHSPIGEDWPLKPWHSPYAISKAGQENIARMYAQCYGFPIVVTRAFGYINPRRHDLSLTSFSRQIAEIEAGKREKLTHGNLESIRAFSDVRDVVRGYAVAADLGRGTYNVGGEEGISLWQCLEHLKSLARCSIPTELDPALVRPADLKRVVPTCHKFRAATGWEPRIPLASSLQWLLDEARASLG